MDIKLWDTTLRVRVEVPEAEATLRATLADHLVPKAAPLGFVVQRPSAPNGLHCLIDRSGLVLARARTWQAVVAVLAEHLTTFAPPPPGTIRTTMRAVVRHSGPDQSAVLAGFPLLSLPPMVERQLERRGQRVVDRLAVDMTAEGELALTPLLWPELRTHEPPGHGGTGASGTLIDTVLVPMSAEISLGSHHLVALIGSTLSGVSAEVALGLAERLASHSGTVPLNDVAARRRALGF